MYILHMKLFNIFRRKARSPQKMMKDLAKNGISDSFEKIFPLSDEFNTAVPLWPGRVASIALDLKLDAPPEKTGDKDEPFRNAWADDFEYTAPVDLQKLDEHAKALKTLTKEKKQREKLKRKKLKKIESVLKVKR